MKQDRYTAAYKAEGSMRRPSGGWMGFAVDLADQPLGTQFVGLTVDQNTTPCNDAQ